MSEPREGQWLAKPLKSVWGFADVNPYGNWIFRGIWLASIAFVSHPGTRLVIAIGSVLLFLGFLGVREVALRWPRRKTETLLDRPTNRDEFLVIVTVLSNAGRLGSDRGVLWFEDGAMGFSGERLSFLLSAGDLWKGPLGKQSGRLLPTDAIGLNCRSGPAFITVRSIGQPAFAFRQRLQRFQLAAALCDQPRQWPPLETYVPALSPRSENA